MAKRLVNGSDEYYQILDDIEMIYEEPSGSDREKSVKKMRKYLRETYGDDETARYLIDNKLKYY